MANTIQHDDFGEKIGGAKKDLWSSRGLYSEDLLEMNSREADKYVKKDNIWKKPDYQALIDSGIPVDVVYWIKKVRDSLNASPRYYRTDDTPEKRLERQKEYIETIRQVQSVVEKVQSLDDILEAYIPVLIDNGYVKEENGWAGGPYLTATEAGRQNPVITDKLAKTLYVRSEKYFSYYFTEKAKKEQFGVPKEEKIPKGYRIHYNDGKNTFSKDNDWKPDTYYVTKGYSIIKKNLSSREEALKWVQDFQKQRGGNGKKRFVPEQLASVKRTGPDYRSSRDVAGQDYLDTFGFRGGEFGNWMTQNDRRASLNMGFDALKDLADALKISEKDIAYQGTLSIAFGARGSGNAVAHYEPLRKVINLTKMRGAGSLAHEWWHGLDDYLGVKMGVKGYLSEHPRTYPLFQKLIDTMKYKPQTPEQAAEAMEKSNERLRKNAASWIDSAVLPAVRRYGNEASRQEFESLKSEFLSGKTEIVEKLSAFKKSLSGHVIPKADRDTLQTYERLLHSAAENTEPVIGRAETDYYRNSKEMGRECEKDGGYWESDVEMTARAFATYIKDKLPYRSDYLAGHAESACTIAFDKNGESHLVVAFPQGEERKAINAVFDEIVQDLKRQNILTHSDRPQTLEETRPVRTVHSVKKEAVPVITNYEQITLFGNEKPSVLQQLSAGKEHHSEPEKKAPAKKNDTPEL